MRKVWQRFVRYWRWLLLERPMRFTHFGTFYILFTIAVGAAAINTGNNLLHLILGIQLSLIIVSGFLSDSGLWGLRSEWRSTDDLFAGRSSRWLVHVQKGWFPAVLIKVVGEFSAGVTERVWLPWIAHRGSSGLPLDLTPRQRGFMVLEKVRYSTAFPFGLFEKTHTELREDAYIVFPSTHAVDIQKLLPQDGDGGSALTAQRAGDGSVPWHLRDYRPGDSLRRMDWKAAAKRQRWIVKETEEDSSVATVLSIAHWPIEGREHFISFIASILWAAMKTGRAIELITPDRHFAGGTSPDHYRQAWRYLALVDAQGQPAAQPPMARPNTIDAVTLWNANRHDTVS